jgi:hypothetical protein
LPVLQIERDGFISFNEAERQGLTAPSGDCGGKLDYSRSDLL